VKAGKLVGIPNRRFTMPHATLPGELATELVRWADEQLESGKNILATSNQGTVLHYRDEDHDLVLKSAMGRGAALRTRQHTLEREYAAYRRIDGVTGVPRCFGLLDGRYLALEFVRGTPYREAVIPDREAWFAALLETLQACHARGVAHGDLKNKSNLMNTDAGTPCVIDFGLTAVRRDGFRPLNHGLFRFFRQLDLNAWVKHKYEGRFENVSEADQALYHDSALERLARRYRQRKGWQGPR
jgi:tRNA A-37 threonylcarbamoyl transferase component Bud32